MGAHVVQISHDTYLGQQPTTASPAEKPNWKLNEVTVLTLGNPDAEPAAQAVVYPNGQTSPGE